MHPSPALKDLNLPASWVTIGSFDGVHLGHQAIIRPLTAAAHAQNIPAVVVTFYPHPAVVLRGPSEPLYLTSPDERAALLAGLGIDSVVTLPFDRALAALSADEFMQLLARHLGIRQLWVGDDFVLGRGRQGTIPVLRQIGAQLGYHVQVTPRVDNSQETISSSLIRRLLRQGELEHAARLLGRRYFFTGVVARGDGRGRGLGIPTANLAIWPERLLPPNGVYATWAWVNGRAVPSITNIGQRPTFENQPVAPRIEAHLLDFDQDLYQQPLKLDLVQFIRPEHRFSSPQALIAQIHQDIQRAREVLTHANPTPGISARSARP